MLTKREKIIKILLIVGTVLAALKMIFVDYGMDEEYQIMMAYRNLNGDILFGNMWEPHQSSAFLCAAIMGIYHAVTGTYTGVILFMRLVTTFIQIALCIWIYRVIKRFVKAEYAFYITLIYFNVVPKLIEIPEFGNMQLWFWTVMFLSFIEFEINDKYKGNIIWLILAGLGMSLEVLSYPSSILIFPVALLFIAMRFGEHRVRNILTFGLTCVFCAGIWLTVIFSKVSPGEFFENVKNIIAFDYSHSLNVLENNKLVELLAGIGKEAVLLFICGLLAGMAVLIKYFLIDKRKAEDDLYIGFFVCLILFSEVIQLLYWTVLRGGYDRPQIHLLAPVAVMICLWKRAGDDRKFFSFGLVSAVVNIVAVLAVTNLEFCYSIPHALIGTVSALVIITMILSKLPGKKSLFWSRLLLISFALLTIFGKGFTLRGGRGSDITGVRGIMKEGPAIGILGDYMCCYIYNSNYEDFRANVEPGDNVLIVTNMVFSPGTTPYMFVDADISHFSIVDPTSYDEKLLAYWEKFPEKQPNVIVVDCWYGELMEDPDNWIMNYIENDFGYRESSDGKYVRFYKRQ
ncbi:MAG: glycosyltransferase family 39 protein [Acetatifactor sp.]|nr:glycosyltransferase family 39 protein [Acetatifactor sp.]